MRYAGGQNPAGVQRERTKGKASEARDQGPRCHASLDRDMNKGEAERRNHESPLALQDASKQNLLTKARQQSHADLRMSLQVVRMVREGIMERTHPRCTFRKAKEHVK